jgi:chromosome segregation ATPase
LSTLTKVLIVLLTVFSIFLCGIVVTYVANANNEKETATNLQRSLQSAKASQAAAVADLEEAKKAAEALKAELNAQIADLDAKNKELVAQMDDVKRQNSVLMGENQQQRATTTQANELATKQHELFKTAQTQLASLQAEQTNRRKELDETNQMLLERMAVISELEGKVRRLTEENLDVEAKLNQYLQQYGRIASKPVTTVAPRNTSVQPVQPASAAVAAGQSRTIALNGKITAVDIKNKLAEISIGAAAGVRQEMKFHITRGDRWVADMLILEVGPDKAVGIVELIQQGMEPKAGDIVATNL